MYWEQEHAQFVKFFCNQGYNRKAKWSSNFQHSSGAAAGSAKS
ncbi:hypothetical protein LXL04_017434 [Taraxacum kok-saghyz]